MLEQAGELLALLEAGDRVAVATVVDVEGSAPRPPGAAMLVEGARAIGSISGGCVEGAVYEAGVELLADEAPGALGGLERFGISDELALSVGLSCGGELEVYLREIDPATAHPRLLAQLRAARSGSAAGWATVVRGPAAVLGLGFGPDGGSLDEAALAASGLRGVSAARLRADLAARMAVGRGELVAYDCEGDELVIFHDVHVTAARLLIFGAVDFSAALADAGKLLGYAVTVCDARPVFATRERFPSADEVVRAWPHEYLAGTAVDERTVVCVLTHDERFDVPLLRAALALPVAYVGAMGSRRTHERRMALLREAGVTEKQLARLHSPIGLDLGASTPQETAVSILAEVIASRTAASGRPLGDLAGPIHR